MKSWITFEVTSTPIPASGNLATPTPAYGDSATLKPAFQQGSSMSTHTEKSVQGFMNFHS